MVSLAIPTTAIISLSISSVAPFFFAAKKKGATDEMLKEMFAVVGLANKNNKLVDSYQVEVDDFLK